MHVLQDREPRHEPRRQRRLAWTVGIDRAAPLFQKPPVDRCGELRQRMAGVDDLVEPRPEKIVLSAIPTLLRPHPEPPRRVLQRQRITPIRAAQFAGKPTDTRSKSAKSITSDRRHREGLPASQHSSRATTLGRKNYLFAGSDEGGRRAAIMYTLIETARFNDIDPEAWLADLIGRIADHPIAGIDALLPWNWRKEAPQAIVA